MKLLFCPKCQDVFKLDYRTKHCNCAHTYGRYLKDGLNAEISEGAIPLGFANGSFVKALQNRPDYDWGERFEAFVIEKNCPTVKVLTTVEYQESLMYPEVDPIT